MEWCFNCGTSGDKTLLFDAISDKGIVKICRQCSLDDDMPIINKSSMKFAFQKPKPIILKDLPKKMSNSSKRMYERLSRLSGIKIKDKQLEQDNKVLEKQEDSLRQIVNQNVKEKIKKEYAGDLGLIDNFHWVIMRARRAKHLTQEQLAKEIAEPESAVRAIEQGIASNDARFIKKIENHLGIKISKALQSINKMDIKNIEEKGVSLSFDPLSAKNITISDLQKMKKQREQKILEDKAEYIDKDVEKELSDDDINDIIFGR